MKLINPIEALVEGRGSYFSSKMSDSLQRSPCDGYITYITTYQVSTTAHISNPQMVLTGDRLTGPYRTTMEGTVV